MEQNLTNRSLRTTILRGAIIMAALLLLGSLALAGPAAAQDEKPIDHSLFEVLQGPFASGPEVTAACLTCHADAAKDMMQTPHWTWEYTTELGQQLGKNNIINNYCVAVTSNWARCTSCHVGYGYANAEFDFSNETLVDCLVCHDSTGTYKKFPAGAGHPAYEEKEFPPGSGKIWSPLDLAAIAQAVGAPSRANCGSCHFNGGGAPGVKHGDLDPSMVNPGHDLDVHMDADGLNFQCRQCHVTQDHQISGSRYEMSVAEVRNDFKTCVSCHEAAPHENEDLNRHTARIACQTCHIPEVAKEFQTKMWWDWSKAGDFNEEGKPYVIKDENGWETYNTKKGEFIWEKNIQPDYLWFNGQSLYIELGDTIDPQGVTPINTLLGDITDSEARIFPVKTFRAVQPYDSVNNTLVIPHLFGKDENAYWKGWDWGNAIAAGMETANAPYSGEYGWAETVMYWPLNHQVSPKEQALACEGCHSENGRLDFIALGYSQEKASILMTFPPVEPTVVPEPTATTAPSEAPTEPVAPTEAPSEPPASAESPASSDAPAASADDSSNLFIWISLGVILGGGGLWLLRRNR